MQVPHDILPLRMRGDGELEAEEEDDIYEMVHKVVGEVKAHTSSQH